MKRLLIILSITLGLMPVSSWGQPFDKLFPVDMRLSEKSDVKVFSDQGQGMIFIQDGPEARVLLLDDQMKVQKQFQVFDLPPDSLFNQLGFTYKEGQLSIYYVHQQTGEVQVLSVFSEEEITSLKQLNMTRLVSGSVYWGTFTYEGILHVVRLPRGANTIRLVRFNGGEEFSADEFPIDEPEIFEKFEENLSRIDQDNPATFSRTYFYSKLYHQGDDVYLSLDLPAFTYIIHLDLRSGQKEEFKILKGQPVTKQNSLILGGQLYQMGLDLDSLYLQVVDLAAREIKNKWTYSRQDPIDIQFDYPVKETEDGDIINLVETEEFMEATFDNSYVALAGTMLGDSLVELKIGGVTPLIKRGITGIILEEKIRKTYFLCLMDTRINQPLFSMPEPFVSRRFPPPMMETRPHFQTFTYGEARYFGYWDEANGGYYVSQ
ncbi:MAG: hypothetical protein AAFW00_18645 [Bacteroidota bacterium]